ncbi:hypothetical protein [Muribaculum intestinale]|uniref:hypothetical protein n=1 Tax=Muribaculum intestinale TaxID=1796646 RepID=UPI0025B55CB9|nr:hypothetical protein [Muribaculum intestinale]
MNEFETLTHIIPKVGSVSRIFSNIVAGRGISKEDVNILVEFRDTIPNGTTIEHEIISAVLKLPHEKFSLMLNSLSLGLKNVIDTYKTYHILLDDMKLSQLWDYDLQSVECRLEEQLYKLREIDKDLIEASNSYEMTPFNGMTPSEISVLERRYYRLKAEYDKEKVRLNAINEERKTIINMMSNIGNDIFERVNLKCDELLAVAEKYVSSDSNEEPEAKKEESETVSFFSLSLIAGIYEVCNGVQFSEADSIEFFHAINLHPNSHPIQINNGEKVRVCYLISRLADTLESPQREQWLNGILANLDIKMRFYRSKYRQPISDTPSECNKAFADALREIFGK